MNKLLKTMAALLVPMALSTQASAQSLLQPGVPPATQPIRGPSGTGPQLQQPQAPASQRAPAAADSAAIRDKGPANETPAPAIRKAATAPTSRRLLDATGVPLQGNYIQVAPNRVYDPASKRYYWTVPAGEQQQIVK